MRSSLIADNLNQIRMAVMRAPDVPLKIRYFSKRKLLPILEILSHEGYLTFLEEEGSLRIEFFPKITTLGFLKEKRVKASQILDEQRRILPSSELGTLILSTPLGFMRSQRAIRENHGGVMYCYVY